MPRSDRDRGSAPGQATLGWSGERIALAEARCRDANERISESAIALGFTTESLPFLCECADPGCQRVIQLALREYEEIRDHPTHFLNVPGHSAAAHEFGRVVERHEWYDVLKKLGRAGEVAELTDPREQEVS